MKNKYLKSVLILFSVCLIVGLFLSSINLLTEPIIENKKIEKVMDSLLLALPDSDESDFEIIERDNLPETITGIYRNKTTGDYAITVETASSYSKDNLLFTVGATKDGIIKKIAMVNYSETRDVGSEFLASFEGKDYNSQINTVAGVTYSSRAIISAVKDALLTIKE